MLDPSGAHTLARVRLMTVRGLNWLGLWAGARRASRGFARILRSAIKGRESTRHGIEAYGRAAIRLGVAFTWHRRYGRAGGGAGVTHNLAGLGHSHCLRRG